MASKLTQLAQQKNAVQLQTMSRQSIDWLRGKVSSLRNPLRLSADIMAEKGRGGRFKVGGLYFFYYDPKGKDGLPYYDTFPLVLILEKYPDGFLGLNLHYLPIKYRLAFLDKLMDYAVLDDKDDIKRMRVTYDILNASKKFKEFKPCLKKYLHGHVKSKIVTVQPNEWDVAAFLPVHQFHKESSRKVWQESLEDIRGQ